MRKTMTMSSDCGSLKESKLKVIVVGPCSNELELELIKAGFDVVCGESNFNKLRNIEDFSFKEPPTPPLGFECSSFAQQDWRGIGKRRKGLVR